MFRVLPQSFFDQPALRIAPALLGSFLVRRVRGRMIAAMITDVEVYDGVKDRASHAHCGKTPRNAPMFGPGGEWYVYFVYGMHWMVNIVTGDVGYPAAILIRGVDGISGPARVAKHFLVTGTMSGKPATQRSGLWIEDRGIKIPTDHIRTSPRIGVAYAGATWAKKPYRFFFTHV